MEKQVYQIPFSNCLENYWIVFEEEVAEKLEEWGLNESLIATVETYTEGVEYNIKPNEVVENIIGKPNSDNQTKWLWVKAGALLRALKNAEDKHQVFGITRSIYQIDLYEYVESAYANGIDSGKEVGVSEQNQKNAKAPRGQQLHTQFLIAFIKKQLEDNPEITNKDLWRLLCSDKLDLDEMLKDHFAEEIPVIEPNFENDFVTLYFETKGIKKEVRKPVFDNRCEELRKTLHH